MNGDPARARFFAMQAMRLGGLMMVIAALLGLNGVLPVPPVAAWPLLIVGLIEIFVIPQILARHWRTIDE
ncbi:hypothetical protein [Caenibius sp. WL]|uniref:hypothetical protein n=1 Tax=Caenibius sp. WL TaxID=2872646 RepID=UPI001C999BFD|nr:hypothetical protein [Caenibius sp. WL]QZP08016.1 hypothetical protein K5X80_15460 [Caenibius sp. WL]